VETHKQKLPWEPGLGWREVNGYNRWRLSVDKSESYRLQRDPVFKEVPPLIGLYKVFMEHISKTSPPSSCNRRIRATF
jgi:hypothetical protein